MDKAIKNTINLGVGFLFILGLFFTINPPTREPLGIYIAILVIGLTVYVLKQYRSFLIGFSGKNITASLVFAVLLGGGYYLATRLIPGFSLGLPLLPNAISDQLKFFIVVIVAPFVETIAIQGALLGYLQSITNKTVAVVGQALVFSVFHLAAYIAGFYSLPNLGVGLSAVSANLSGFLAAFIFALIAGIVVMMNGIKNLWFVAIFHLILNLIIYTSLSVVFALTMGVI